MWNRFDFTIAVLGAVRCHRDASLVVIPSLLVSVLISHALCEADLFSLSKSAFFSVLRAIRVLRPLRFISRAPELRRLTTILIATLPKLPHILILLMLTMVTAACVGLQLFKGAMRRRCFSQDREAFVPPAEYQAATLDMQYFCGSGESYTSCPPAGSRNFYMPTNASYANCQSWGDNPGGGLVHFDNIGNSLLTVWIVLSKEQWAGIMNAVMESVSFWTFPYFIVVIIVGSYMSLNLFLVVISLQFTLATDTLDDKPAENDDAQEAAAARELAGSAADADAPPHRSVPAWVTRIAESPYFGPVVSGAIVANTIVLATQHHNQPAWLGTTQDVVNVFFTFFFLGEILIKLTHQGLRAFWQDAWNAFDFVVVLASIVELIVLLCLLATATSSEVSVLRTVRLLRLLRFMNIIPGLQKQVEVLVHSMQSVLSLFLLTTIFMFIAAVLGMYSFGGKLTARSHYDTIGDAMLTVFTLVTLEDFPPLMYESVQVTNGSAAVYYIAIMIIGTYVLGNLLVAILLQGFDEREKQEAAAVQVALRQNNALEQLRRLFVRFDLLGGAFMWWEHVQFEAKVCELLGGIDGYNRVKATFSSVFGNEDTKVRALIITWHEQKCSQKEQLLASRQQMPVWRQLCARIVQKPAFERVMMAAIVFTAAIQAVERPAIESGSVERRVLDVCDYFVNACFLVEMLLKIAATGFYGLPGSYLSSWRNVFDGFLVLISVIHAAMLIVEASIDISP